MKRELNEATPTRPFELTGGKLCLDFANTLYNRATDNPQELVKSYSDLLAWGRQVGIFSETEAENLARIASRNPAAAKMALRRALHLRELIYRVFSAIASDRAVPDSDLNTLHGLVVSAIERLRIAQRGRSFTWTWKIEPGSLDHALWMVAKSAGDVITSNELSRLRKCTGDSCAWLFMDTTKNGTRKWCDMKICGNRNKVKRYRQRLVRSLRRSKRTFSS